MKSVLLKCHKKSCLLPRKEKRGALQATLEEEDVILCIKRRKLEMRIMDISG